MLIEVADVDLVVAIPLGGDRQAPAAGCKGERLDVLAETRLVVGEIDSSLPDVEDAG